MPHQFAEVSYTLTDLIVAAYNINDGSYGTPARFADGQLLVSEPEADTDKLRGYGQYTRGLTVPIGARTQLKGGGVDFDVLAIIAAANIESSGSAPNRVRTVRFPVGGSGLPYFGVIGVSATDDGGVAVIGLEAVKLDTVPKYTMDGEANKFNIFETAGYAFPQTAGVLETLKTYETASDWTRPVDGAAFKAFFS